MAGRFTKNKPMVKLYYSDISILQNEHLLQHLSRFVSAQRCEKTKEYRFIKDKALSIGAELLLQYALKKETQNLAPFVFLQNALGKPYLKNENNLFFNLSHSGQCVAVAVGDRELGVDIEQHKVFEPRVAKRVYTPFELQYIEKFHSQNELFYNLWVAKESFIKAIGTGLTLDPQTFSVEIWNNGFVRQEVCSQNYFCKLYPIEKGYSLALCMTGEKMPKSAQRVDMHNLVSALCEP